MALKILFAASEAAPFAQTGGLGEVLGSLPQALAGVGCDVRVLLPGYRTIKTQHATTSVGAALNVPGYPEHLRVLRIEGTVDPAVWLVDAPRFFDRDGDLYSTANGQDWPDNPERFACFSHAVTTLAVHGMPDGWRPDVVHVHDWQTALVPLLLASHTPRPRTVFTIHNLAYRGLCDFATFTRLHLPPAAWDFEALEFHGQAALIKGGLVYADRLTTVSPGYAREIQTLAFGCGLDGLLRRRANVLAGIMNGIDLQVWDPAHDSALVATYDISRVGAKAANKRHLQQRFRLPLDPTQFLLGIVTRLAEQKGVDLILAALPALTRLPLQFLFLGNGNPALERRIIEAAQAYPQHVQYHIGFDVALSHQMFAGLDAFMMPSRFEPCGLAQLYSLRYGTVPIVHRTGGLADSVIDLTVDAARATGFVFDDATSSALIAATHRALEVFHDPARWQRLQRNGMTEDNSWRRSAAAYRQIYQSLVTT